MTAGSGHNNGGTLVLRIPMRFRRHGGRKMVLGEDASPLKFTRSDAKVDTTLVKALARAHRWKRMLESGEYSSITDRAKAEKINHSYVRRLLRLTVISPTLTEAILDGTHPAELCCFETFAKSFPVEWVWQARMLGSSTA